MTPTDTRPLAVRLRAGTKPAMEQDRWHERGFASGIAVACSTMFGTWGDEVPVEEILCGAGLDTRAKMKALGVDDYDLDILKPIFKTLRERKRATPLRAGRGIGGGNG